MDQQKWLERSFVRTILESNHPHFSSRQFFSHPLQYVLALQPGEANREPERREILPHLRINPSCCLQPFPIYFCPWTKINWERLEATARINTKVRKNFPPFRFSICLPRLKSQNILKRMWKKLPWRKMGVIALQNCPDKRSLQSFLLIHQFRLLSSNYCS